MRTQGKLLSMAFTMILLNALPLASRADEGMIMMSGDCAYMVLDTTEGQALIKRVTGPTPETGDILEGEFDPKEFSTLTNRRTGETLKVWVDVVDAHGNRALSRHGRYCR
jgi:hypothetical protein